MVCTILHLEEVGWHIKNVPDFSCLKSLTLGYQSYILSGHYNEEKMGINSE